MRAVKHNPDFARRVGVPRSVGAEFVAEDRKKFADGGRASQADVRREEERLFREWYQKHYGSRGLGHPDHPLQYYDYRAAWMDGSEPGYDPTSGEIHGPSKYKLPGHPRLIVDGIDTRTGNPQFGDLRRKSWDPTTAEDAGLDGRAISEGHLLRPPIKRAGGGLGFIGASKREREATATRGRRMDESPGWQFARSIPRHLALSVPAGWLEILGQHDAAEGLYESETIRNPPFRAWEERLDRRSEEAWRRAAERAGRPAAVRGLELDPADLRSISDEEDRLEHARDRMEAGGRFAEEVLDEPFARVAESLHGLGASPDAAGAGGALALLGSMTHPIAGPARLTRMLGADARSAYGAARRAYYRRYPPYYTPPPALPAPAPRDPNVMPLLESPRRMAGGGRLTRAARRRLPDAPVRRRGVADIVKDKGGNWVSYDIMSPRIPREGADPSSEDMIRSGRISGLDTNLGMIEIRMGGTPPRTQLPVTDERPLTREDAIGSWVDRNLRRYLMTNWGTKDDPLADLLLHGLPGGTEFGNETLDALRNDIKHYAARPPWPGKEAVARERAGDIEDAHLGELAARAETIKDYDPRDWFTRGSFSEAYTSTTARPPEKAGLTAQDARRGYPDRFAEDLDALYGGIEPNDRLRNPDWLEKLPDDATVYDLAIGANAFHDRMGRIFEGVADYFRTLPPDRIKNISVPDAVRNSAAYHEELSRRRTDEGLSSGRMKPYRDYPSGYRWVELTDPDALKQEGQAMGHCVGSYCEAVESGETRILSLRDPQGRSHVTVEVRPGGIRALRSDNQIRTLLEDHYGPEYREAYDRAIPRGIKSDEEFREFLVSQGISVADFESKLPASIRQIKYKGNSTTPVPEYVPYVRDLVRGGEWDEINDLQSSGLIRIEDPRAKFFRGKDPEVIDRLVPLTKDLLKGIPGLAVDRDLMPQHLVDPVTGEIFSSEEAAIIRRKPWKKPYYYATPEELAPYERFKWQKSASDEPFWGTREEMEARFPGVYNDQLYNDVRRSNPNRGSFGFRLQFPDDFEGFAKGGVVDADALRHIDELANRYGVPPAIVRAVRHVESRGRSDVVSPKGARGEMQLMPETARGLGVDPNDPRQNREGGVRHLARDLKRFNDVRKALAAYVWGPARVARNTKEEHWPAEVRKYVADVLSRAAEEDVSMSDLVRERKRADEKRPPPVMPAAVGEIDTKGLTEADDGLSPAELEELRWMLAEIMGDDDAATSSAV